MTHGEGKRILIVEDEANIAEAMTFILERAGWRVTSHADGADAVARIAEIRPDVVVLDVMLPNRSGYDILEDLRASDDMRDLPVLMLTAKGQAKDRDRALAAGASAFMTKPFSNAEVVEAVNALCAIGKVGAVNG